jgi:hypothetical protein
MSRILARLSAGIKGDFVKSPARIVLTKRSELAYLFTSSAGSGFKLRILIRRNTSELQEL